MIAMRQIFSDIDPFDDIPYIPEIPTEGPTQPVGVKYDKDKPPLYYNYHLGWDIYWKHIVYAKWLAPIPDEPITYRELAMLLYDNTPIVEILRRLNVCEKDEMDVSYVCSYGANKYGNKNYLCGISEDRLLSAFLRHMHQLLTQGVCLDDESRLPHRSHAIANLLMHLELYQLKH